MTENMTKINDLFDELVPGSGKADTVAGELVRAVCRIGYRNYNDGDHIGVGYGKETCNAAARFLMKRGNAEIVKTVTSMWGMIDDEEYDEMVEILVSVMCDYIEQNPELKTTPNTEDIWEYFDKKEDRDDEMDEEEYW